MSGAAFRDEDGSYCACYRCGHAQKVAAERDRLRAEIVGSLTAAGIAMLVGADPTAPGEIGCAVRRLAAERDRAIAHDRQPYPTVDAYEKACAALHTQRALREKAEADLAAARERVRESGLDFAFVRRQRDEEKARADRLEAGLKAIEAGGYPGASFIARETLDAAKEEAK